MTSFGHLNQTNPGAEPYAVFCRNLAQYISKIDLECPQNRETHVELRNLVFGHFVAAHRLTGTAMRDDPVLCDFRREFMALSTAKHLQIVGLMHAYGAQKCYADSPRTMFLLFGCIAAAYDMPDSIVLSWRNEQDMKSIARFRAKTIAQILGRPEDAASLAPTLHVVDRKILLYLAFLVQESESTESIETELNSFKHRASN